MAPATVARLDKVESQRPQPAVAGMQRKDEIVADLLGISWAMMARAVTIPRLRILRRRRRSGPRRQLWKGVADQDQQPGGGHGRGPADGRRGPRNGRGGNGAQRTSFLQTKDEGIPTRMVLRHLIGVAGVGREGGFLKGGARRPMA